MKSKARSLPAPLIVAPAKSVHNRRMPGILILDARRRVLFANSACFAMLKPVAGADLRLGSGSALPDNLQPLLEDVEKRLAGVPESCNVILPSYDICVRACKLHDHGDPAVLLLVERASRQDVVRSALANYPLTPRETEVAELVLRGYPNRHIADQLVLAESTVEDHLKRIFAKVGVRSRSALASKILGIREEAAGHAGAG